MGNVSFCCNWRPCLLFRRSASKGFGGRFLRRRTGSTSGWSFVTISKRLFRCRYFRTLLPLVLDSISQYCIYLYRMLAPHLPCASRCTCNLHLVFAIAGGGKVEGMRKMELNGALSYDSTGAVHFFLPPSKSCVHLNRAIFFPSALYTTASQTCVDFPACACWASHKMRPCIAVPM